MADAITGKIYVETFLFTYVLIKFIRADAYLATFNWLHCILTFTVALFRSMNALTITFIIKWVIALQAFIPTFVRMLLAAFPIAWFQTGNACAGAFYKIFIIFWNALISTFLALLFATLSLTWLFCGDTFSSMDCESYSLLLLLIERLIRFTGPSSIQRRISWKLSSPYPKTGMKIKKMLSAETI